MAAPVRAANLQITGVRELLKELGKVDPELRKQTVKEIRTVARSIASDAKAKIPVQPPMSGWQTQPSTRGVYRTSILQPMVRGGRGWMPWSNVHQIKVDIGRQRKQARKSQWNVARIAILSPAAQVFELSGLGKARKASPTREQFIRNLDRFGRPGRAGWAAYDARSREVQQAIIDAVKNAEDQMNRRLRGK